MSLNNISLDEILVEEGILNIQKLKKVWDIQKQTNEDLEDILIKEGFASKADIMKARAKVMGVEYMDLADFEIADDELLSGISEDVLKKHVMVPVKKDEDTLTVAMKDPGNIFAADDLRVFTSLKIKPVLADKSLIEKAIKQYFSDRNSGKVQMEEKKNINNNKSSNKGEKKEFTDPGNNTIDKIAKENASTFLCTDIS